MPRTRLLPVLSAAWFALVLYYYHFGPDPYPPGVLAGLVYEVLLLALVSASAWGLGCLLLKPLRLEEESPGEAPFFEIGAGLGGLALALFALSAAGLLYRWAVLLVLIPGIVLLARHRVGRRAGAGEPAPWRPAEMALLMVSLSVGLITLACSLGPPEFYDALIYHLAVPDYYIRHHAMVAMPHNFYSGYPANMGMLYAIGLLLQGEKLAQSLHWLCGALAAGALFAAGARHTNRLTGILACALFALRPGIMLVSTWAIADLGVTLFGLLCFAAVLNLWMGGGRRWLVAAGLFAGLALGTKYTAAIVVGLPAAAAIALRPGRSLLSARTFRAAAGDLALFALIAALLVSPWLGRNLVFTGDPVAPYLAGARAGADQATPDIIDEMARRLPKDAGALGLAVHYLAAPWRATMGRLGAGGYLGPGLLMLVPLLLFMRGLPRVVAPLAIVAGFALVAWALSTQVSRYLFPALPPLALLAAIAALRLPRLVAAPAVGWGLLYNLFLFLFLVETTGAYHVVTGVESRDEFLSRRVTYYPAAVWLGQNTPPGARVLFVGEGRGFYCPRDYVASTPFDPPAIDAWAARASGEGDLIARLEADGITHLLVSGPELTRTRGIGADAVMKRYFPSAAPRLVFEKNDVRVYALPR